MAIKDKISRLPSFALVSAEKTARQTLVALGESDTPEDIVRALGAYDLLLVWSLAGDDEKADLLRLAEVAQLRSLVDLSCWQAGLPDLPALEQLLAPAVLADVASAMAVLDHVEPELRTLLLRRHVRIHQLENRNDPLPVDDDAEVLACPDGFYFVEFVDPDSVSTVQRGLWNALLRFPFAQYHLELECMRHDLAAELEEQALRWREGRLADQGFASYEESRGLLAPRTVTEVRTLARKRGLRLPLGDGDIGQLPALFRERLVGQPFLDEIFEMLQNATDAPTSRAFANLEGELGLVINRFLTATRTPLAQLDEVRRQAMATRDLLALGLYEVADGDAEEAAAYLVTLTPGYFVQVACGLLYPLRDRARRLLAHKALNAPGHVGAAFDPPHLITLQNLAEELPCRWPQIDEHHGLVAEGYAPLPHELVTFATRDEVTFAIRLLEEAEELPALLAALGCSLPLAGPTPASVLLLTALANDASGKPLATTELSYQEATVFGERALTMSEEELQRDALEALASVLGISELGPVELEQEGEPLRRLLLRVTQIGLSRLRTDAPHRVLIVEN